MLNVNQAESEEERHEVRNERHLRRTAVAVMAFRRLYWSQLSPTHHSFFFTDNATFWALAPLKMLGYCPIRPFFFF